MSFSPNEFPFPNQIMSNKCSERVNTSEQPNVAGDSLIAEREKTHGSFAKNAQLWYDLWGVFEKHCDFAKLTPRQHLALDMLFAKLARLAQHPEFRDHWIDGGKYLELGGTEL